MFRLGELGLAVIEGGQNREGPGDLGMLGTQHLFLVVRHLAGGARPWSGRRPGGRQPPGTEIGRDEVTPCRWDQLRGVP